MPSQTRFLLRPDRCLTFWDRSKHHRYLVALLIAERLTNADEAPGVMLELKLKLKKWASDPSMAYALSLWQPVAAKGSEAVANAIIEITSQGEALRDTMPPVIVFAADVMAELAAQRRRELETGKAAYQSAARPRQQHQGA